MQSDDLYKIKEKMIKASKTDELSVIIDMLIEKVLARGEEYIINSSNNNEFEQLLLNPEQNVLTSTYIIYLYNRPDLTKKFIDHIVCLYINYLSINVSNKIILDIAFMVDEYLINNPVGCIISDIEPMYYFRVNELENKLKNADSNYNISIDNINNSNYKKLSINRKIKM